MARPELLVIEPGGVALGPFPPLCPGTSSTCRKEVDSRKGIKMVGEGERIVKEIHRGGGCGVSWKSLFSFLNRCSVFDTKVIIIIQLFPTVGGGKNFVSHTEKWTKRQ